jgi:gluconate 2-dehydrogenase gamma chain
MSGLSRRELLKAGIAGAAAGTVGAVPALAQNQPPNPPANPAPSPPAEAAPGVDTLFFFNSDEAQFVEAFAERLIPADPQWGGAKAAGVLYFIDHQLAGAYGVGDRMYLNGPWDPNAPTEQGYQLKYSPAELYRTAIAEIRAYVGQKHGNAEFWQLKPEDMDAVLKELEGGKAELESVPSAVFFETILANAIEGYFADPVYGGNRDMVGWRMIGFPGAYSQWVDLVDQYDSQLARPPLSIGSMNEQADTMKMGA